MRGSIRSISLGLALILAAGCALRQAAPYDAGLNEGLAELQVKVDAFLEQLEGRAGTPEGAWERHASFYEGVRRDVEILRSRAAAHAGNDITLGSLDRLAASIDDLERLHRAGLKGAEIPILRTLFDSQLRMLIKLEGAKKRPGEVTS